MSDGPNMAPYSLIVPYKDFLELLESARKAGQFEIKMQQLENQLTGLRGLYSQLLEKVGELNRLIID